MARHPLNIIQYPIPGSSAVPKSNSKEIPSLHDEESLKSRAEEQIIDDTETKHCTSEQSIIEPREG